MIAPAKLPDHTASAYFVYGLRCPDTNQLRYVGKTCNPKARMSCLLAGANAKLEEPVHQWIADLAQEGKSPRFEILSRVTGSLAWRLVFAAERQAIRMLSFCHPLLNVQHNLYRNREARRTDRQRMLTCRGKTRSLSAWAKKLGISRQALHQRLKRHKPSVALTVPKGELTK